MHIIPNKFYILIKSKNILKSIFFILILLLGLIVFKDYGSFYDEPLERLRGIVTYKYLGEKLNIPFILSSPIILNNSPIPSLEEYADGDHGPLFDIIAVGLEIFFNIQSLNIAYQIRHLIVFIFFWLALFSLFSIVSRRFSDERYGFLAVIFFLLSPRLFADAFYNSKDIVFLSLFLISANFSINFLLSPNFKNSFLSGFFAALATDVRLMGILIPISIFIIILFRFKYSYQIALRTTSFIPAFLISFIFTLLIFWPWLWSDPLSQIQIAFSNMAKFPNQPPTQFFGRSLIGNGVPWHYIPSWILISTPILYLFLFLFGFLFLLRDFFSNKIPFLQKAETNIDVQNLLFFGLFFGPILVIIILRSILYDGWRHMYFIYPFFIIIALNGVNKIFLVLKYKFFLRLIFQTTLATSLLYLSIWMFTSHPYQNLFFNSIVGSNKNNKFDSDYWSTSLTEALRFIAKNNSNREIRIFTTGIVNLSSGLAMLPQADRLRFFVVSSSSEADFILTNFRGDLESYSNVPDKFVLYKNIIVDGSIVFAIFRSKKFDDTEFN